MHDQRASNEFLHNLGSMFSYKQFFGFWVLKHLVNFISVFGVPNFSSLVFGALNFGKMTFGIFVSVLCPVIKLDYPSTRTNRFPCDL